MKRSLLLLVMPLAGLMTSGAWETARAEDRYQKACDAGRPGACLLFCQREQKAGRDPATVYGCHGILREREAKGFKGMACGRSGCIVRLFRVGGNGPSGERYAGSGYSASLKETTFGGGGWGHVAQIHGPKGSATMRQQCGANCYNAGWQRVGGNLPVSDLTTLNSSVVISLKP